MYSMCIHVTMLVSILDSALLVSCMQQGWEGGFTDDDHTFMAEIAHLFNIDGIETKPSKYQMMDELTARRKLFLDLQEIHITIYDEDEQVVSAIYYDEDRNIIYHDDYGRIYEIYDQASQDFIPYEQ